MYPILKAEKLADKIYLMVVEAPRVARACEPGEFVIVKMGEEGERIPLTIDRKSTRLNSSHNNQSRMPSSA